MNRHTYYIEKYDLAMMPVLEIALKCHPEYLDEFGKLICDYNDFHVYFYFYRTQILDFLKSENENNYGAALLLTIPIIDRASQIALKKSKPSIDEWLTWLGESSSELDLITRKTLNDNVRRLFVNGLKHDAFVRKGVSIKTHFYDAQEQAFPVEYYPEENMTNVHPIHWCRFLIGSLDFFYLKHIIELLHVAHNQGYEPGKFLAGSLVSALNTAVKLIKHLP